MRSPPTLSPLVAIERISSFARQILSMCENDEARQDVASRCGSLLNDLAAEASRRRSSPSRSLTPKSAASIAAIDAAMAASHQPDWKMDAVEETGGREEYKTPVAGPPPRPTHFGVRRGRDPR